ncbi:MarP family serine protease [Solicola gregarius]|uniref:MarP family serine protease n=1 Tax=Solicola gregarius TaxID=2908642 RepID=A0AA46TM29_9ACTN|nr:MarP family serine protease [Solicola gregarius]UYM07765.1 MarP family serine protease [Solicola gregarius]
MNVLDLILILVIVVYGMAGYWQGFVTGAAATGGLLIGGVFGIVIVPVVLGGLGDGVGTALLALVLVLICATVGQACGTYVGTHLRDQITWNPARSIDAVGGAVLSVVAVLVIAWCLGYAVSGTQIPGLSNSVRSSAVLSRVDDVMPDSARDGLQSFNSLIDSNLFPRYLEPFVPEQITHVRRPNEHILGLPVVRRTEPSVVKVIGEADDCDRGVEGSGFVYASERVMTNAHVVAGVDDPTVVVGDTRYDAETVVYNEDLDIAILAVDGLTARPLGFDLDGGAGANAVVMGYPDNGPFDAVPARIRAQQELRSPNIYDDGIVRRQVFSIRGLVRSGNSGGPLMSERGEVYGVVFAASVSDDNTGYVLTAEQVQEDARLGVGADQEVSTGGCT